MKKKVLFVGSVISMILLIVLGYNYYESHKNLALDINYKEIAAINNHHYMLIEHAFYEDEQSLFIIQSKYPKNDYYYEKMSNNTYITHSDKDGLIDVGKTGNFAATSYTVEFKSSDMKRTMSKVRFYSMEGGKPKEKHEWDALKGIEKINSNYQIIGNLKYNLTGNYFVATVRDVSTENKEPFYLYYDWRKQELYEEQEVSEEEKYPTVEIDADLLDRDTNYSIRQEETGYTLSISEEKLANDNSRLLEKYPEIKEKVSKEGNGLITIHFPGYQYTAKEMKDLITKRE